MLPNIFLIQMSGISIYNPNHITWYLSSMLIAMFILYPLAYQYYDTFIKIIIPIISILILGNFTYFDKALTGVSKWIIFTYKGTIRAIVEIALGMLAFEISQYLKTKNISKIKRNTLQIIEYGSYAGVIIFSVITCSKMYEVYALILLFIGITITFSQVTHIQCLDNSICEYLGKLSLPIYLCQLGAINIGIKYFKNTIYSATEKIILIILIAFFMALSCKVIVEKGLRHIGYKK